MKKTIVTEEVGQHIPVPGVTRRNIRTTITYFLFGFIPVYQSTEDYVSVLPN